MKTIYILTKEGELIAEIKTTVLPNGRYFFHALAHAFSVDVDQVVPREKYDSDHGIYRCSICREVQVDALGGYDTCPDCIAKNTV